MNDRASLLELLGLLAAAGYIDGKVFIRDDEPRPNEQAIDVDAESPPRRLVSV